MAKKLSEIAIRGLHGRLDLRIPIVDNRVVLVGVNGLGKTTVVNILFFFLTRQWRRLLDYRFEEVSIKIGECLLRVEYKDLQSSTDHLGGLFEELPPSIRPRANRASMDPTFVQKLLSGQYSQLEDEWQIPPKYLRSLVEPISSLWHDPSQWWSHSPHLEWEIWGDNEGLSEIGEEIEKAIDAQILYLPTYRRIEQDLRALLPVSQEDRALLPVSQEDMDRYTLRQIRNQQRQHQAGGLELVQFGMGDVQKKIRQALDNLKEKMRVRLGNLTGSYLSDIIRGHADKYKRIEIKELDSNLVAKILDRVEKETLSEQDKRNLQDVIEKIKSEIDPEETEREKYLAHFFSKLVDNYNSQLELEESLRKFVDVCNEYLVGKSIIYDDVQYNLRIETEESAIIQMRQLSSGEKQIISLLSHVYLGDADSYFIIIDEPELSLSVEWQKRLLPDLARSNRCEFIAAVTHSPFIFDNEFESYTRDLQEYIVAR